MPLKIVVIFAGGGGGGQFVYIKKNKMWKSRSSGSVRMVIFKSI